MQQAYRSWAAAWRTGFHLAETWGAAAQVVAARSVLIGAAVGDPLRGDWPELSRMAPEKLAAFGQASGIAAGDAMRLYADGWRMWAAMAQLAAAGQLPSLAQAADMTRRLARAHGQMAAAPGRALGPVRRAAVANARRLKR